jgi:hypothetical protein
VPYSDTFGWGALVYIVAKKEVHCRPGYISNQKKRKKRERVIGFHPGIILFSSCYFRKSWSLLMYENTLFLGQNFERSEFISVFPPWEIIVRSLFLCLNIVLMLISDLSEYTHEFILHQRFYSFVLFRSGIHRPSMIFTLINI